MSKKKKKYYTVWKGHHTGIFETWEDCKAQIKDFKGAQYKSFSTFEAAKKAYKGNYKDYVGKTKSFKSELSEVQLKKIGKPNLNSIAVDAASSGNPGKMEYRGVDTKTRKQIFIQGPFEEGTNNIGEFLAIVHGLALLKKKNDNRIIYTDSRTAMSWVREKTCNTKLERSAKNEELFSLVDRAVSWLNKNHYTTTIVKWETKAWGEIPADFGRK
ncbi:ribonuclease H family protein [Psychroserpens sp.]|uniref:ribonuclease H family protein n=1 Tax=Psychroserpens sp. TaxID=2020870 RepID=UPI001B2EE6F1|nr:ribonuclease H family protein [Psychroserpens sp.]MBO6605252.1 ribonuclease H family protein [Psychroserpens sp.]MBO6630274.1 ribonuclease H family protein [Psychroserpens sp.]MBO6653939.1 ribonuclease H family protein [Psychroserpens sp.]MBO6682260.1 ribonuclease H family protein [Psychroserpens sp.]MBO6748626.1 ribonuclease H family protein [Psychroserpens sp.]